MEAQTRQRIAGLDLMKSLGVYLVIVYHMVYRHADRLATGGWRSVLYFFPVTFLSVCVPLFFTASGALSLTRPLSLKRNTLRCVHLALLTVFWVFASLGVVLLLRRERPGLGEFLSIAYALQIGYIQHLWYLPAFLFLTLLTPVLHGLRRGPAKNWRYGLLLLGVFTFGNTLLNDGEYLLRWLLGRGGYGGTRYFFWYVDYFAYFYWYAVIYLALGAFLLEHRQALKRRRRLAAASIPACLAVLTVLALARSFSMGEPFNPVFYNYDDPFTLMLTGSVGLLLMGAEPGARLRRAAASLSECSLGIYLLHWLVIEALLDYFPAVTDAAAFAPLTAIPVLAVSWGLTWVFLRIPLVRNLFTATPNWIKKFA